MLLRTGRDQCLGSRGPQYWQNRAEGEAAGWNSLHSLHSSPRDSHTRGGCLGFENVAFLWMHTLRCGHCVTQICGKSRLISFMFQDVLRIWPCHRAISLGLGAHTTKAWVNGKFLLDKWEVSGSLVWQYNSTLVWDVTGADDVPQWALHTMDEVFHWSPISPSPPPKTFHCSAASLIWKFRKMNFRRINLVFWIFY